MQARILIKVLNASGDAAQPALTAETGASVAFVPEAMIRKDPERATELSGLEPFWQFDFQPETYMHAGEGHYVPDPAKAPDPALPNPALEPVPGQWLLVVQANGKTPVTQRLTLSEKNGLIRAAPGWKTAEEDRGLNEKQATAETVHIFNYSRGAGPELPAVNTLITITLFPRTEIVHFAGFDAGGTSFIRFAEVRRLDLHKSGRTNNGTRSAYFDAAKGTRKLFVKAKSGWLATQTKLPNFVVSRAPPPTPPDRRMGILELYRYLNQMGFEAPGSIIEVMIFSHAFVAGPILWNTFDRSDNDVQRDPRDIDGRSKDWQTAGVMGAFPDLVKSLAPDAIFKVGGCHFDPFLVAKFRAANTRLQQGFPRDQFFVVELGGNRENTSLDVLKHQVGIEFSGPSIRFRTYCAAAAAHLDRPCFGTPPGTGANFINTRMVAEATDPVYAYLRREFNLPDSAKDDTGHMNYQEVVNQVVPKPTWSTEHWLMTHATFDGMGVGPRDFPVVRLPGRCTMMRHRSAPAPRRGLPFVVEARQGLVEAGKSGHLYFAERARPEAVRDIPTFRILFIEGSDEDDCGVYVQSDRQLFIMRRIRPSTDWIVDTRPINLLKQARSAPGSSTWVDDPATPPTTITNGVLFVDTEETHW